MKREERLEAMSAADPAALIAIADEVLATFEVEVTRGPTVGLLMMRVEEPVQRLPFNFTEVTVSEAEVSAGPHRGYAMVMGRNPEHALAAAVLDAAVEAEHPLTPHILDALASARDNEARAWATRWARTAPTRVQFEDVT